MGEALNVALSARSRACCSLLLAIVAIGVVLFGAIYVAPEAAKIKTTAAEVESRAIQLKADHSHLSAQLETLRSSVTDLGTRLAAAEKGLATALGRLADDGGGGWQG